MKRRGPPSAAQGKRAPGRVVGGGRTARRVAALGVALYNQGRFWEAHEAWEVLWRRAPQPERDIWQGLIHAAAAMLHRERGNAHGLAKLGGTAIAKLRRPAPQDFPVETARFVRALERTVAEGGPVPPMELAADVAASDERTGRRRRDDL